MSKNSFEREKERQYQREKMAEVRSYKRRSLRPRDKIKQLAENENLVNEAKRQIDSFHKTMKKLLRLTEQLDDAELAKSLGYSTVDELFKKHIQIPVSITNKLRRLAKLNSKITNALKNEIRIKDYRVLDFFDQLNDFDLTITTLKILNEDNNKPNLKNVIETIKRIHVNKLKNFNISESTLEKFQKNKYVSPTRADTSISLVHEGIDADFEVSLTEEHLAQPADQATQPTKKRRKVKRRKS